MVIRFGLAFGEDLNGIDDYVCHVCMLRLDAMVMG